MPDHLTRSQYVAQLLLSYARLPDTLGVIRSNDRRLAAQLFDRSIPITIIEAAFLLATARRRWRSPHAYPLPPVRSLHYYLPVIQEVLANPLAPDYCQYLRSKLATTQSPPPDY